MPREYKPDLRGKQYKKHTAEAINRALADHQRGMSFRACSKKHGIPIAVLCRRAQNPRMKSQGGQTALKRHRGIYGPKNCNLCILGVSARQ